MPQLTITFNLPEDDQDSYFALNGSKYWYVLKELDSEMRRIVKYDDPNYTPEERSGIEKMRNILLDNIGSSELKWDTIE